MSRKTDKEIAGIWREAVRLAQVCTADERALPEHSEIVAIASALICGGLVTGSSKSARSIDHAGADEMQQGMLSNAYEGE